MTKDRRTPIKPPAVRPGMEHHGEMKPVRYQPRPSLTFRFGAWLYEKLKGRG